MVWALFRIHCLTCKAERMAEKLPPRGFKCVPYPVYCNRCLCCGRQYEALPPTEDDGERGPGILPLAPDAGLL